MKRLIGAAMVLTCILATTVFAEEHSDSDAKGEAADQGGSSHKSDSSRASDE